MAEEMILESLPWESDESEDSESDEALIEAADSVEDIGERARRRRAMRRGRSNYLVRGRGVRGLNMRGQKTMFPTPLATTAETNRGLATQEVGRRALEERLDRLETRSRVQQKNNSSVSGVVSLAIGIPLAAWGLFKPTKTGGTRLGNWSAEETTRMATLTSAGQLATTGAKLLINGRYHRSGVGIAADAFAAVQLATYAFGSMHKPRKMAIRDKWDVAWTDKDTFEEDSELFVVDLKKSFLVVGPAGATRILRPI